MQKKFVKTIQYRSNIKESYDESLKAHNLLTLFNRRKMFDIVFLFKILNHIVDSPTLLSKVCFLSRVRLPLRSSRTSSLFVPPRLRKNYTRNTFIFRSTNTYNKQFNVIDLDLFNVSLNTLKQILIKMLLS